MAKKQDEKRKIEILSNTSNGGENTIDFARPYIAQVTIRGVGDSLFHAWNSESVAAKAGAAKGSKAKKTDDIESYVYRNEKGEICIPGSYLRGSIVNAAKFRQDPRSPRKSAMDMFKAGVVALTPLASLGTKDWDYIDRQRVVLKTSGAFTRERPAMRAGWEASFEFSIQLPEYISSELLSEVIVDAGRLVGVGDHRPTFGRFVTSNFKIVQA